MNTDKALRRHVISLLQGRGAHMDFEEAIANFPMQHINTCPLNVTYSFWHLLEHLRITQWDILEYTRDPKHISPPWPQGYWPAINMQADEAAWLGTANLFRSDLQAMIDLVNDSQTDLL